MEYEITWGGNPEDICICTSGVAESEAFRDCTNEVLSDPRARPGLRIIFDHRQLDVSGLTLEGLNRVAQTKVEEGRQFQGAYVAAVVKRDVDFGLLRMLESVFEAKPGYESSVRVFRSIEEARLWLAICPAPEALDAGS